MNRHQRNSVSLTHMLKKRRLITLIALFFQLFLLQRTLPIIAQVPTPVADSTLIQSTVYFHSGAQEGSTAIAVDAEYMLVGDDQDQTIRLYHRHQDGEPVTLFDFTDDLNRPDTRQVDIEGSARMMVETAGGPIARIYWIASHSNSGEGKIRPSRYRLFATDIQGSGAGTTLSFVNHYDGLRTADVNNEPGGDLIAWGEQHGYGLKAKAMEGVNPESIDGFNIEGLAVAPDGASVYIGFRAPLVGASSDMALIAPLKNVDNLVTGQSATAEFGDPIELDLGGRGIRSIERNDTGEYLIIAGPPGPNGFQLYTWSGNPSDIPVNLHADLAALNAQGSFEGIVGVPSPLCGEAPIQLLVDNGDLADGRFRTIEIPNPCPQMPTEIMVANANDSGTGSLRQAIADLASGGALTFDPTLADATITLTSGPLNIAQDMTLDAAAAPNLTLSGNDANQVFTIAAGVIVTMRNLVIRRGYTPDFGGGIANAGDLTIINSTLADNNADGSGGAIDNAGALTIINSGLYDNASLSFGGAIANDNGSVTIQNSTLAGNHTNGSDPNGDGGGAINQFGDASTMNITLSTITNNSAPNVSGRDGIWLEGGSLTIRHSIVAGNGADGSATNCTISGGGFIAIGENIGGDASCTGFSKLNMDPLLDPLADNGGPTFTRALRPGSPAIDAIAVDACDIDVDQRGVARPRGVGCDIGAFESETEIGQDTNHSPTFTSTPAQAAIVGSPYNYAITTADPDPGDTRMISAVSKPIWLTFTDQGNGTATLVGTPSPNDVGDHNVILQVSDAAGANTQQSFTIKVKGANQSQAVYLPVIQTRSTSNASDPVFVGAGDIAQGGSDHDEDTAKLLDDIPGTVYVLGDNAYSNGSLQQYNDYFAPTWGRHRARMKPVPGNHEYNTAGAEGYYTYFGAAGSPLDNNCTRDCKGYYAYDLGAWHIIALNSEIAASAGSAQEQWLRADLADNPSTCTLAYWHKPRFSSGAHQNDTGMAALWQALYDYGVDVVLNGHDHNYERFAPQDPNGQADPTRGIREFVVGTGGTGARAFGNVQPNSEVRQTDIWGVLKLTLHAASYDWEFVPIAGQSFQDTGNSQCITANASSNVVDRRVGQSTDDAEERLATDPIYLNSSDLELTVDLAVPDVKQTVGIRFSGVTIPPAATISRAYLEFVTDEASSEATSLQIAGAASGNAATFTAAAANISQRSRTTASVGWNDVPAWSVVGETQRSPDLTAIVQEIVNRNDWSSGNALAFIITGTGHRVAASYDKNPQTAPLLHVEFSNVGTNLSDSH